MASHIQVGVQHKEMDVGSARRVVEHADTFDQASKGSFGLLVALMALRLRMLLRMQCACHASASFQVAKVRLGACLQNGPRAICPHDLAKHAQLKSDSVVNLSPRPAVRDWEANPSQGSDLDGISKRSSWLCGARQSHNMRPGLQEWPVP